MRRLLLLAALLLIPALAPRAEVLHVLQHYQEQTQWCWAGTSQAMLEYYGLNFTQTQIAAYGTEGANEWNWLWGQSSNPTRRGIDMIMMYFRGLATDTYSAALSLAACRTEIEAVRPFFLRWGWDSGGGHFTVVHGVEGSTLYLMDPWYGPTINSYDWVVRSAERGHTWTHSLAMETSYTYPASITLASALNPSGQVTLEWNVLSNRFYDVWFCTNLPAGKWTNCVEDVTGPPPNVVCPMGLPTNAPHYFRVHWDP